MWTVELPVRVQTTKKQSFSLNLNQYRNAHHFTLDKAKKTFRDIVSPRVRHLPRLSRILITYTFYAPSKQRVDTGNVVAIVDKFFCDVLVSAGKLEDDNCLIVAETRARFGGVDRANPRVEATIEPLSAASRAPRGSMEVNDAGNPLSAPQQPLDGHRQEKKLKIQIVQREIEEAVRDFIRKQIAVKEGMEITMNFSATRGADGLIADIDISPVQVEAPQAEPAQGASRTSTRPAARVETPADEKEKTPQTSETSETSETQGAPQEVAPSKEAPTSSQASAGDAEDEPEAFPGEKPLKPSIFGNLRRPSNSADAGAAGEEAAA